MKVALDPHCSVVVEACAGSGKTWLLASRLIRILLAGVAPSKILAITYTRKAAAEIEARLSGWLRDLAALSEPDALAFLRERGLSPTEAVSALPRARGLFEEVVLADRPPTITTFHGWFVRLVQAAPLHSGLSGYGLAQAAGPLLDEAWAALSRECARQEDTEVAQALVALFEAHGFSNVRELLGRFVDRRAEWAAQGLGVEDALAQLRALLGVSEQPTAEDAFFAQPGLIANFTEFARLLCLRDSVRDRDPGLALTAALASGGRPQLLKAMIDSVLKKDGTRRDRSVSKAMEKNLGKDQAAALVALHDSLADEVVRLVVQLTEEAAYRLNHDVFRVGQALLDALDAHKRARRLMDFTDLETYAAALLAGDDAPFLQARLDARYQHILLDEFQDTNPLQWNILKAWFDAYGPGEDKPQVFMVGDPKQSIYRFRRAEARIFKAAEDYLKTHFNAHKVETDTTRRNPRALVEVINRLFEAEPHFAGFRPQAAHDQQAPGRIEVMPLISAAAEAEVETETEVVAADQAAALRHPLFDPAPQDEASRREQEAQLLVQTLKSWVGRLMVHTEAGPRALRYDDVMLLCRNRTHLAEYEQALAMAAIPYFSGSRGGLLDCLEVEDLAALLGLLESPGDDLKLAHVLRSPIFAASDDDLLALARAGEGAWWQRLAQGVAAGRLGPALTRAQALLCSWRELAAHWPVHDVLNAIYDDADVMARYAAAVPALMWPGVRANLEAFIRLSLEQDGGRHPSLSRFNDEIKRLKAAREEAPDEGLIVGVEDAGRVSILTIHGAKGLEAPLVWLIDAHGAGGRPEGYDVLLDWPPDAPAPRHFSVFGNKDSRGAARKFLFDQEEAARQREELNLLYVALTRARQYFVVSGVESLKKAPGETFYTRIQRAVQAVAGDEARAFGDELAWQPAAATEIPVAPGVLPRVPKLAVGRRREEETRRQRYGTALHLALESLTRNQPVPEGLDTAAIDHAKRILSAPHLAHFFDERQFVTARMEVEFALPDGTTGRIDRLVDTGDAVWVLDYKAGRLSDAPLEDYAAQLNRYRRAVTQLQPNRVVRCGLIFGDAQWCEVP